MRWRFIAKTIGILILYLGLSMLFPLICGLFYQDNSLIPIAKSIGITICAGTAFFLFFRNKMPTSPTVVYAGDFIS